MPPPHWKACPACNQMFSPKSLEIHLKRCREHKDVKNAADLFREERYMRSYHWAKPLPSWNACPNCDERYSPIALGPHIKRCRRLRPDGPVGIKPQGRYDDDSGAFEGMWGVDSKPPPGMLEKLGNSLKSLVAGEEAGGDAVAESGSQPLDVEERKRLRELFYRFDANGDGSLSQKEHGMLLFNCFPERILDAKDLLAEFKTVNADGSGLVSFEEFLQYYGELLLPQATSNFEEAADMFGFFDADHSGELDQDEFLALLNNIFPTHCDENEKALAKEFAEADTDGSSAISFSEFCAYYDRLVQLYGEEKPLSSEEYMMVVKEPKAAAKAKKAAASAPKKAKGKSAPKAKASSSGKDEAEASRVEQLAHLLAAGLISQEEYDAKVGGAPDNSERIAALSELLSSGLITQAEYDAKLASLGASTTAQASPPVVPGSELVTCEGCGEMFLPHLRPKHQRSCAAAQSKRKTVQFTESAKGRKLAKAVGGGGAKGGQGASSGAKSVERPLPKPGELNEKIEAEEKLLAQNGANTFVPCEKCGRSFFPDRLPVHMRACKGGKKKAQGEGAAEAADARRAQLDQMLEAGLITQAEYDAKI